MADYITMFKEWIVTMGDKHGVNPMFLGCLYLGSKVFFFSLLGWVLKNLRAKKPIIFPLLFAFSFFSVPYVYLIIAGRNISVWVYIFIALLFTYGIFSIW